MTQEEALKIIDEFLVSKGIRPDPVTQWLLKGIEDQEKDQDDSSNNHPLCD